ncbi:MAG: hypothetical protein AAF623_08405 [Planctomycetota bacterium]
MSSVKRSVRTCPAASKRSLRRGVSTMDYVLVIGVILPLVWFLLSVVPRMIQLVYDLAIVVIGSPLM